MGMQRRGCSRVRHVITTSWICEFSNTCVPKTMFSLVHSVTINVHTCPPSREAANKDYAVIVNGYITVVFVLMGILASLYAIKMLDRTGTGKVSTCVTCLQSLTLSGPLDIWWVSNWPDGVLNPNWWRIYECEWMMDESRNDYCTRLHRVQAFRQYILALATWDMCLLSTVLMFYSLRSIAYSIARYDYPLLIKVIWHGNWWELTKLFEDKRM
jgi:hypothetical protein